MRYSFYNCSFTQLKSNANIPFDTRILVFSAGFLSPHGSPFWPKERRRGNPISRINILAWSMSSTRLNWMFAASPGVESRNFFLVALHVPFIHEGMSFLFTTVAFFLWSPRQGRGRFRYSAFRLKLSTSLCRNEKKCSLTVSFSIVGSVTRGIA